MLKNTHHSYGSEVSILLVLVTYDVSTDTKSGQRRLRKVAKKCEAYGIRVQNSVFECIVDNVQFFQLKKELSEIIDKETDSLRFYQLGNKYKTKVEHMGAKTTLNVEDPLIL